MSTRSPAQQSTVQPESGHVLIDYNGRTGHDHAYPHRSAWSDHSGPVPIVLWPGLNIVDRETWSACKDGEIMKRRLDDGQITVVDESFRAYSSNAKMADLVKRTQSAEALELLQAHMLTKPQTGKITERRDPEIMAQLERKIPAYSKRTVPNYADLGPALQARVAVMTSNANP